MHYEMEELVPIVGRLAQKYTAGESTSVTYEKAEQLMEAVLYCIREAQQEPEENAFARDGDGSGSGLSVSQKKLSAEQAYKRGAACVEEKVRQALKLYHQILPEFCSYENDCLYDTFVKGIPEFFKWYDAAFCPQDTILTLDYPVLKDLSRLSGIDRVYEFINCIRLEQKFLKKFSPDYVMEVLEQYTRRVSRGMEEKGAGRAHPEESACGSAEAADTADMEGPGGFHAFSRREIMDNLCEIVFPSAVMRVLLRKPLSGQDVLEAEAPRLREMFSQAEPQEIRRRLGDAAGLLFQQYDGEDQGARPGGKWSEALSAYLSGVIDGLAVRLKNMCDCGIMEP